MFHGKYDVSNKVDPRIRPLCDAIHAFPHSQVTFACIDKAKSKSTRNHFAIVGVSVENFYELDNLICCFNKGSSNGKPHTYVSIGFDETNNYTFKFPARFLSNITELIDYGEFCEEYENVYAG